ncbi:MAG: hypothetical protein AAGE18_18265 [Pseudomonadota bacterium]
MERLDAGQPVACSLNDREFRERRSLVRETIAPRLVGTDRLEHGVILRFEPAADLRSMLRRFVDLERQCCGFLSFTILPEEPELPADRLVVTGPEEASATLDMFAKLGGRDAD